MLNFDVWCTSFFYTAWMDTITLADIFKFDYDAGIDEEGRFKGDLEPTGLRPMFTDKLGHQGIELPPEMFDSRSILASAPGRYAV